jgi:hypothetical protein
MRVNRIQIQTFMVKIARTRDEEASCDDCARLSAQLVEAFMHGEIQSDELLTIVAHLEQCIPCSEEFAVLKDCMRMEEEGSWPTLEEMWNKLDPPQA